MKTLVQAVEATAPGWVHRGSLRALWSPERAYTFSFYWRDGRGVRYDYIDDGVLRECDNYWSRSITQARWYLWTTHTVFIHSNSRANLQLSQKLWSVDSDGTTVLLTIYAEGVFLRIKALGHSSW